MNILKKYILIRRLNSIRFATAERLENEYNKQQAFTDHLGKMRGHTSGDDKDEVDEINQEMKKSRNALKKWNDYLEKYNL